MRRKLEHHCQLQEVAPVRRGLMHHRQHSGEAAALATGRDVLCRQPTGLGKTMLKAVADWAAAIRRYRAERASGVPQPRLERVGGRLATGSSVTWTARTTRRRRVRNICGWQSVGSRVEGASEPLPSAPGPQRPSAPPIVLYETDPAGHCDPASPLGLLRRLPTRTGCDPAAPQTGFQALINPPAPLPSVCQCTPQVRPQTTWNRPELGETAASRGAVCFAMIP